MSGKERAVRNFLAEVRQLDEMETELVAVSLSLFVRNSLSHTEGLRAHAESARETDGAARKTTQIDDEPMRIVESEVEQIALWLHRVV